jgi:hypothetical protein
MSNSKKKLAKKMSERTGLSHQASVNVLNQSKAPTLEPQLRDQNGLPIPLPEGAVWKKDELTGNWFVVRPSGVLSDRHSKAFFRTHDRSIAERAKGAIQAHFGWGVELQQDENSLYLKYPRELNLTVDQGDKVDAFLQGFLAGNLLTPPAKIQHFESLGKMFRAIRDLITRTGQLVMSADIPAELKIGFLVYDPKDVELEVHFTVRLASLMRRTALIDLTENQLKLIQDSIRTAEGRQQVANMLSDGSFWQLID